MRVLIDTNVFIKREGRQNVPEPLQELEKLLRTQGHDILVHPLSKEEVRNYEDDRGRELAESKIATYADLRLPRYPASDGEFHSIIDEGETFNERVDNALLYAVFDDQVDVLITEDKGIQEKAETLDIGTRVYSIEAGCDHFRTDPALVPGPPSIQKIQLRELDTDDPIFDSLKQDYDFEDWVNRHPERDAWINRNPDGTIGAILAIKPNEVETIGDNPVLGKRERLKISTLKVAADRRGSKTGELLISIAIREAVNHEIEEIYLTHYVSEGDDFLVRLIAKFGFQKASETDNGEAIFTKRIIPGPTDDPDPQAARTRFYPSFYDGPAVNKFLVPVKPVFHSRLFTSYEKRQPKLREFEGRFYSEGNAIKKAYVCRSPIRKLKPDDIVLFYRTQDHQSVTSLGVVEKIEYGISDADELEEIVGRRSVFSRHELEEYADKPTTVILFSWHFDLPDPIHYQQLLDDGVIQGPIRSIQGIEQEDYKYIRKAGGIDERFTIN